MSTRVELARSGPHGAGSAELIDWDVHKQRRQQAQGTYLVPRHEFGGWKAGCGEGGLTSSLFTVVFKQVCVKTEIIICAARHSAGPPSTEGARTPPRFSGLEMAKTRMVRRVRWDTCTDEARSWENEERVL